MKSNTWLPCFLLLNMFVLMLLELASNICLCGCPFNGTDSKDFDFGTGHSTSDLTLVHNTHCCSVN